MQVSPTSPKANLSESSNHNDVHLEQSLVFAAETPSFAHGSNSLCPEKLKLSIPCNVDSSVTQSDDSLTNLRISPQENENLSLPEKSESCDSVNPSSVTPDSSRTTQDDPDDQINMSSEPVTEPSGSGSPQLDQLLSDLEEMKLKFRSESLDPGLSKSSDESPEDDQSHKFVDLSPEDQGPTEDTDAQSINMQLAEDANPTNVAVTGSHLHSPIEDEPETDSVTPTSTNTFEAMPSSFDSHEDSPNSLSKPQSPQGLCEAKEPSLNQSFPSDIENNESITETTVTLHNVDETQPDISEEHLSYLHDPPVDSSQGQEKHELAISSLESKDEGEELSKQITQAPAHLQEETSVEVIQSEDFSSQSLSDLTPETVTSARHFSFEELIPYSPSDKVETCSDEDRPRTSGQHSEESLTPVDSECFSPHVTPVKPKAAFSSTSDDEYSFPPGYTESSSALTADTDMPPAYAKVVHGGEDSPTFYSDPEPFFDCKQAQSDFSETEADEPDPHLKSVVDQTDDHRSHLLMPKKVNRGVLLSSESEDYEDAPFIHEPLHNVEEENEDASDEEYSLCETVEPSPVCDTGTYDDTDKCLTRVRGDLVSQPASPSQS